MVAFLRWRFVDPSDPDTGTWVLPRNPSKMTSPFPARAVTYEGTSAIDGQVLMWEGRTPPEQWSFGGITLSREHYDGLKSWVYDRQGRLFVYDHFGRRLTVLLTKFSADPPPVAKPGRYWWHEYTIEALVLAISAPAAVLPE